MKPREILEKYSVRSIANNKVLYTKLWTDQYKDFLSDLRKWVLEKKRKENGIEKIMGCDYNQALEDIAKELE